MQRACQAIGAICLLCGLASVFATGGGAAQKQQKRYDGRWWQSITQRERLGFVAGFIDCYDSDYQGPPIFQARSLDAHRDLTTQYYQGRSSRLQELVTGVLTRRHPPDVRDERAGERAEERHGFFDGLYWMQMSVGGVDEPRGFIEGHLSCYSSLLPGRAKLFRKSPAEYREQITMWYRFVEATGDVDAERQHAKIADVLFRFRRGAKREPGSSLHSPRAEGT